MRRLERGIFDCVDIGLRCMVFGLRYDFWVMMGVFLGVWIWI